MHEEEDIQEEEEEEEEEGKASVLIHECRWPGILLLAPPDSSATSTSGLFPPGLKWHGGETANTVACRLQQRYAKAKDLPQVLTPNTHKHVPPCLTTGPGPSSLASTWPVSPTP